jgi:hypothetical protein
MRHQFQTWPQAPYKLPKDGSVGFREDPPQTSGVAPSGTHKVTGFVLNHVGIKRQDLLIIATACAAD